MISLHSIDQYIQFISEKVTVELHKRLVEDANFDNVSSTEKDKPYLYPYDPNDPDNQKVTELSALTGKIIGPAKVISIGILGNMMRFYT
jgi:hypothetical protein